MGMAEWGVGAHSSPGLAMKLFPCLQQDTELARTLISIHMDMWGLFGFVAVKVEPVRATSEDCRHP